MAFQWASETEPGAPSALEQQGAERGFVVLSDIYRSMQIELEDVTNSLEARVEQERTRLIDLGIEVVDDVLTSSDFVESQHLPEISSSDSLRVYLSQIGEIPLLEHEELVDKMKRYRAGLAAGHLLEETVGTGRKRLSRKDVARLNRIIEEGRKAKKDIVAANLRLVVTIANRMRNRGLETLALIQEGNLGLIRAVEKFDYSKGYTFSTYAKWWIKQSIQRGIGRSGRAVQLPMHIYEQLAQVKMARFDLRQELGREPNDEEVAREAGISLERLNFLMLHSQWIVSLDEPLGDGSPNSRVDGLPDDRVRLPEDIAVESDLRHAIAREVLKLGETEQKIVALRYGLFGNTEHSVTQVARRIGLTREVVKSTEHEILARIRAPLEAVVA